MNDWFEEMEFVYRNADGTVITHKIRGEDGLFLTGDVGSSVSKGFARFLNGAGFSYVEDVEFIKEAGE